MCPVLLAESIKRDAKKPQALADMTSPSRVRQRNPHLHWNMQEGSTLAESSAWIGVAAALLQGRERQAQPK